MLAWDDLASFLAIARHGTLSGAARALGVRQTTMGRRLAGLEARAGARLLQKTPRGYVMTAAGEAILGNVERIESEALAIERRITGQDVRLEGVVRVTTVEALAVRHVAPALAGLARLHPGIVVELVTDDRNLSLTMREADIALRVARPRQQDVAARRVATTRFALCAAESYLAARGRPDFAAGGAGHALVTTDADQMEMPEMRYLAAMLPGARPVLRTNSRDAQRAAVAAGLGIGCLPGFVAAGADLVALDPPAPPPERELWLVVHNDIRHTPRIRAVTDFLAGVMRGIM